MIQINITVEGRSELNFVNIVLKPHLWATSGILVHVRAVLTSKSRNKRGGITSYHKFKNDVTRWLKGDTGNYHTSLIDLYGLGYDFPGYETSTHLRGAERARFIEAVIQNDINYPNFFPHIQPYEFESLLFSDPKQMAERLKLDFPSILASEFQKIVDSFEDPENINDSPQTAPSKRILKIAPSYDKPADSLAIIQSIGLPLIRAKCPHFNDWITKLEKLA